MVLKWSIEAKKPKKQPNVTLYFVLFYYPPAHSQRPTLTLVGEPMMVGSGDFCSQSDVRGEEPSSLVGDEPRLAGRPS